MINNNNIQQSVTKNGVRLEAKSLFNRVFFYIIGTAVFAVVVLFVAYSFFETPKERMLEHQNKEYVQQIKAMNQKIDQLSSVLKQIEKTDDNIYRAIFSLKPVPAEEREAGIGGVDRYAKYKNFPKANLFITTAKKLDRLSREIYVENKSSVKIDRLAQEKSKMMHYIPGIQPVYNKDLKRIADLFGLRHDPFTHKVRMHAGVDFAAKKGTPVHATGDGIVERLTYSHKGYGREVLINHNYGYESLYGHMNKIIVKKGQRVKRGQIIGYVGSTGRSTGPHLHYEVHKNGKAVNPSNYFYHPIQY